MTYADQISTIIDGLKLEPNSKEKNKLTSKLEDAWAWAKVVDGKYKAVPNEPPTDTSSSVCTCKPGMFDNSCPVHGNIL